MKLTPGSFPESSANGVQQARGLINQNRVLQGSLLEFYTDCKGKILAHQGNILALQASALEYWVPGFRNCGHRVEEISGGQLPQQFRETPTWPMVRHLRKSLAEAVTQNLDVVAHD